MGILPYMMIIAMREEIRNEELAESDVAAKPQSSDQRYCDAIFIRNLMRTPIRLMRCARERDGHWP